MKTLKTAVDKARAFLETEDKAESIKLEKALNGYTGNMDAAVAALKPRRPARVKTGWLKDRGFESKTFADKYPGELLPVYVPENYNPKKAYGVVLFLHGGGRGQPRTSGQKVMEGYGINDLLEASGRIVCFPCSPHNTKSFASWNLPEVDEYLADVIEELEHFYNIDPNNIILGGHSMGGMGAYHIAHRMPDRFASVLVSAGSWDFAYWPCLTGTTLWISQGVNDAIMFKRRHGTDVEFARLAKMRLDQAGVDNVFRQHSGCHDVRDARHIIREWLQWSADRRRDPFYPHVVEVTPRGMTPWIDFHRHKLPMANCQNWIDFHEIPEAPHCRWVTIEETFEDTILFDAVEMTDCRDDCEQDWNDFELKLKRKHVTGAIAEVFVRDDKVIEVTPRNASKLSLWLHPDMVDLSNVTVLARGQQRHSGPVAAGFGTLVASYKRRRDWGLLYPARVTLEADDTWGVKDQLNVLKK